MKSSAATRMVNRVPIGANRHVVRPPLKWAGGKRWQLPHLWPLWESEEHRRLVEPFCGGLAVALGLGPKRALLNDINAHLINFYRHVKAGLRVTLRLKNDPLVFYSYRARFNTLLREGKADSATAAVLFYYLNRTGYNGLCRFNRSGQFNVPFGRYKAITYREDFLEYQQQFEGWEFSNLHFDSLNLRPDDFVYADPPYDVEFTQYSQGGFSWTDQVSTAQWLSKHDGPVILVNQATARIVKLDGDLGYQLKFIDDAPRRISCTGDRSPAREVLAMRNLSQ